MGNRVGDETIEHEGTIEASSAKALLVEFTNGPKEWVPKSQIIHQYRVGDEPDLYVFGLTEWFAKKIGLA